MRFGAIWVLIGGLAAWPAVCQEPRDQVSLQVPEAVVFPVMNLGSKAGAISTLLTFDHARLARGSRLRISVRAEGLDLGTGTPARISYAAHARGGTPFNSSLRDTDYTPVFESDPLTLSGSVEIAWSLEPLGRVDRSGNRTVTLRWKAESIPDAAGRPSTGTGVSRPEPGAAPPEHGEREGQGPGRRPHMRPGSPPPAAAPGPASAPAPLEAQGCGRLSYQSSGWRSL